MDNNEQQSAEEARIILKYWFYSRIFGCGGLLFLFITLITPNWIRINSSLSKISLGLWSICIDDSCRIVSGHSPILDVCRIFLSLSTLCGLVAVSASLISNPKLSQSKWPLITSLATAFMSLIAIVLFCVSVVDKISLTYDDESEEVDFRYAFSFSFVGACVGCVLFFISGTLFALIKTKESAITSVSPVKPEKEDEIYRETEIDDSVDKSLSGLACAYGVM